MKPRAPILVPTPRRLRRLLAALCLACVAGEVPALRAEPPAAAAAAWTVAASEKLPSPAEGVDHEQRTLKGRDGAAVTLHFLSFDQERYTFRVLDQGALGRAKLEEILKANGCLAGTNGSYFQPDFEPVGLVVCDGKVVHPVYHARLLSGALIVTPRRITFRRSTQPLPGRYTRQAVQSGPFLVENGQPLAGLNAARSAWRTAVFTDGGRRWGLLTASPVTLAELGAILADSALLPGGLKIMGALNLDGGSSTGMWAQQPERAPFVLRSEQFIVRDFVGIVPK